MAAMPPVPPRPPSGGVPASPDVMRHYLGLCRDYMKVGLRAVIADPGPAPGSDGDTVARGPHGQPLPDQNVRDEAKRLLAEILATEAQARLS